MTLRDRINPLSSEIILVYGILFTGIFSQSMFYIIVSWLALKITGSVAAVGLVLVWRPLLSVTVGPFIGVLVDRSNRCTLFILGQILQAVGIIWLIYNVHMYPLGQIEMMPLYVTACVVYLGILLSAPTSQGLLQAVGAASLTRVVTIGVGSIQTADILGVLFGGIAIALLGFGGSLMVAAAFSLTAAGLALPLRTVGRLRKGTQRDKYATAIVDGFRLIFNNHRLFMTCLAIALIWSTAHVTMALLGAFTMIELKLGAQAYGWIDAMWGVGTVVGSVVLVWLPGSVVRCYLLRFGLLLLAVSTFGFSMAQGLWSAMLLHGLMGIAFAVNRTAYDAYVLETVDSEMVGRVRNNIEATIGAIGIFVYLSPSLYADLPIRTIYVGFAVVLGIAASALLIWRHRLDAAVELPIARLKTHSHP